MSSKHRRRKPTVVPSNKVVPSSNAARQAAYRKRHLQDVNGQGARVNMIVPVSTRAQLTRLASHYGTTQRDCLARLLAEEERKVVDRLGSSAAQKAYFSVTA
jgi:hypothetical protein